MILIDYPMLQAARSLAKGQRRNITFFSALGKGLRDDIVIFLSLSPLGLGLSMGVLFLIQESL